MRIYATNIEKCQLSISEMERKLPAGILDKIEKNKVLTDYKRSLAAYTMLYNASEHELGKTENFSISKNSYGKPYFIQLPNHFFNISHSRRWIVLAVSLAEIGIDIEYNDNFDYDEVIYTAFAEKEKRYFDSILESQKKKTFYRFWTLKESYIKFLGKGMSQELNSFTVGQSDGIARVLEDSRIDFLELPFYKNYTLSVCHQRGEVLEYLKILKLC